jgi:hypothetical protein
MAFHLTTPRSKVEMLWFALVQSQDQLPGGVMFASDQFPNPRIDNLLLDIECRNAQFNVKQAQ